MTRPIALALLALGATAAHATLVVDETFDAYALGALNGQNGYVDRSGSDLYRVVPTAAGRAVEIDSSRIADGSTIARVGPSIVFTPTVADPVLSIFVDVTALGLPDATPIDSPGGGYGVEISRGDRTEAEIHVVPQYGATAGYVATTTTAPFGTFVYGGFGTSMRRDQTKRLGIVLDPINRSVAYYYDGAYAGGGPYSPEGRDPLTVSLRTSKGFDRARFDNLHIEGNGVNLVPEPATFAALGLGALALLKRRRR